MGNPGPHLCDHAEGLLGLLLGSADPRTHYAPGGCEVHSQHCTQATQPDRGSRLHLQRVPSVLAKPLFKFAR